MKARVRLTFWQRGEQSHHLTAEEMEDDTLRITELKVEILNNHQTVSFLLFTFGKLFAEKDDSTDNSRHDLLHKPDQSLLEMGMSYNYTILHYPQHTSTYHLNNKNYTGPNYKKCQK